MICTCNFSHYGVMLDDDLDFNPHKPTCPFGQDGPEFYEAIRDSIPQDFDYDDPKEAS
jgi:hypothetical protein